MKARLLIYIFLILAHCRIIAQPVSYDSTQRPEIYPLLKDQFAAEPKSKRDIIFLGNSLTFWGRFNEMAGKKNIKNRGIPGDHTFGVLNRLTDIIKGKPAKLFLMIGINDIARNFPDSIIIRNCQQIVQRVKTESPRTKIFLQSILPTNSVFDKLPAHYNKNAQIITINAAIAAIANAFGATYIDLYSSFVNKTGSLIEELSFDGVHLTKKGYDKWLSILKSHKYI